MGAIQMLPVQTLTTDQKIYDMYKDRESGRDKPRYYMGGSWLGHKCDAYLWFNFRKAFKSNFPGRVLRLFETGFREEDRVIQNLIDIGCTVESDDGSGNQIGVSSCGGHIRGHVDALVTGLPEGPKTKHLVDVKTVNINNYKLLLKNGFEKTFPKYFGQGMYYMGMLGLTRAMYIFVVKDTDNIHIERFKFSKTTFDRLHERAIQIVLSNDPQAPISSRPDTWYECKFCDARECCTEMSVVQSCRTCRHISPKINGTWHCSVHNASPPNEDQFHNHKCYEVIEGYNND